MTGSVIIAAPLLIAAIVTAVRFVGCGLSTQGLEESASKSATVLGTPGLQSFWQLDDSSGPTAKDSQDSNDGTYEGTVTLGVNGLLNSGAADSGNPAARFDGQSGYVEVSFNSHLNEPSFTVEAIVQPSGIDANTHVIVSSDTGYQLVLSGNAFEASVAHGGAFQPPVVVNAEAVGGTPYYVAMTYDGTTLQLYVNPAASDGEGTFLATENSSPTGQPNFAYNSAAVTYQPATSGDLRIGASANGGPSEFFSGVIQDVAVYNRALGFLEIVQDYWIFATGVSMPISGPGAATVGALAGTGTLSATAAFPNLGPTTTPFSPGTHTYDIPYWCTFIDLILVGGGGGGSYMLGGGNGGKGGQLVGKTLQRGTDTPWATTSITVAVGSGGTAGIGLPAKAPTSGGATTATWTGTGMTPLKLTAGGGGAGASASGQTGTGTTPGSIPVGGTTYTGGANQITTGGAGNAPGGGGAAGAGLDNGGAGADGAAFVVARHS